MFYPATMEVCGSISANPDYTEFLLNCIYCSNETNLEDWQQFVLHIRNDHSTVEDSEEVRVDDENESLKEDADYYIDNIDLDTIEKHTDYQHNNEDLVVSQIL